MDHKEKVIALLNDQELPKEASNSHDESNFNVGDKVTVEGDDTVYTIYDINLNECWLTHEGRGRGWAKLDSLKHYVEQ